MTSGSNRIGRAAEYPRADGWSKQPRVIARPVPCRTASARPCVAVGTPSQPLPDPEERGQPETSPRPGEAHRASQAARVVNLAIVRALAGWRWYLAVKGGLSLRRPRCPIGTGGKRSTRCPPTVHSGQAPQPARSRRSLHEAEGLRDLWPCGANGSRSGGEGEPVPRHPPAPGGAHSTPAADTSLKVDACEASDDVPR
jgi:hypothetical protein